MRFTCVYDYYVCVDCAFFQCVIHSTMSVSLTQRNACDTVFIVMRLDEKESKLFWCAVKVRVCVVILCCVCVAGT